MRTIAKHGSWKKPTKTQRKNAAKARDARDKKFPMPPDPKPLTFRYYERRGDPQPTFVGIGGHMSFTLDEDTIQIECQVRPGNPPGLLIRTLSGSIDIEPHVSNTIIVKPRKA